MTLPRRSSSIKRPFATYAARKGRAVVTAVPTPKTQVHDTTLFLVLAFAPKGFQDFKMPFPFLKTEQFRIIWKLEQRFL